MPNFDFAPAKNFIKKKPPRPRRRPGAPGARHGASQRCKFAIGPHLPPALSPPSDGAERENYSPPLCKTCDWICRTRIRKTRNVPPPFLLPGEEDQDEEM